MTRPFGHLLADSSTFSTFAEIPEADCAIAMAGTKAIITKQSEALQHLHFHLRMLLASGSLNILDHSGGSRWCRKETSHARRRPRRDFRSQAAVDHQMIRRRDHGANPSL
jgi:hypothetical protein